MLKRSRLNSALSWWLCLLLPAAVAACSCGCGARGRGEKDYARLVNPFIGTAGGGNTFPGAVRPWGMVSTSPHTAPSAPSGYYHGQPFNYGFGMVHLSGTGCADLGSVIVAVSRGEIKTRPEEYRSAFSEEQAEPAYYSCLLQEPAVRVRTSATERCGIFEFVPLQDGEINIQIDAGRNLSRLGGGAIRLTRAGGIEGFNIGGGFCGENNRHQIFFSGEVNLQPADAGVWRGEELLTANEANTEEEAVGGWLRIALRAGQPLMLRLGISYVSIANARENLRVEIPHWDFERVRRDGREAWQEQLSAVHIREGSEKERIKFYTALYHSLIHPGIISDVNGEYPLMGRSGTGCNRERARYSVFSLWDTYRTLHPLLTLLYPSRQSEIIQTMLDMYQESGFLPKWELAGNETYMMVGDGAVPVISDSYIKGIEDFDVSTAWQAMTKAVFLRDGEEAPPLRAGYHELLKYQYIPFEQDTSTAWWVWGPVSTTQEYCLADWTLAQVAQKLGKSDAAAELLLRSGWYKNLFDPRLQLVRPRLKDGSWLEPFDPLATEGSGSWAGSGGPGFVEGNAWQYTWFAPHDVAGLIGLFGGPVPFSRKLQECFENGQFTINNEPDLAYPWLFTWLPGEESRAGRITAGLMANQFSTAPDGLPGNDDCGTISAWFVFAALGFYPACPAAPEYRLSLPLFAEAELKLDRRYWPGESFIIRSRGGDDRIELNGIPLAGCGLRHDQITAGGELCFDAMQEDDASRDQ